MTPSALVVDEWHSDTTPLKLQPINSPSEASSSATIIGRRPSVGSGASFSTAKTLATFYRGSCLVGILVGASFIFSPINPIGIFDTESPATHFFRALCGISIALVLAPAQSILWRAAKAGELTDNSSRALNAALGLASGLLVIDGRLQVEEGTRQFAALDPSSAIAKAVELDPEYIKGYMRMSTALLSQGRFNEASSTVTRALVRLKRHEKEYAAAQEMKAKIGKTQRTVEAADAAIKAVRGLPCRRWLCALPW